MNWLVALVLAGSVAPAGLEGVINAQKSKQLPVARVGNGPNQAITPDQVHQTFGADIVKQMAAKIGMSPEDMAAKLSQILPQTIDKLTPGGAIPKV